MIKQYKCMKQDTFKVLEVGRVYNIEDDRYILNDSKNIRMYTVTRYMLDNLFEEV